MYHVTDNRAIEIGPYHFGFQDVTVYGVPTENITELRLGPLGDFQSPVSAQVGATMLPAAFLLGCALAYWVYQRRMKTSEKKHS